MNPYTMVGSGIATNEAVALATRLAEWHDAVVAHERKLRTGRTDDGCDEDCPHAQARLLWADAVATFGARADDLTFLRSRATGPPAHGPDAPAGRHDRSRSHPRAAGWRGRAAAAPSVRAGAET